MVAVFVDDITVGYGKSITEAYLQVQEEYAEIIKIGSIDINQ